MGISGAQSSGQRLQGLVPTTDISVCRIGDLASPTEHRMPRQNDDGRHPGRSAERHVWSDRWRRPLWMKRECIGMGSKPWAILHRHPLDPEVAQQSVTPGFLPGAGGLAWGLESPGQSSTWRILLRFTGAGIAGSAKSTGVLAIARKPSPEPEIVRRVTGDLGPAQHRHVCAVCSRSLWPAAYDREHLRLVQNADSVLSGVVWPSVILCSPGSRFEILGLSRAARLQVSDCRPRIQAMR